MKKIITLIAVGTLLISSNLMAQAYINLGVADADLNLDPTKIETVNVTVTSDHGETEIVTLTESDVDSARFTALVPISKTDEASTDGDGKFNVNQNTNLKVVYTDDKYGTQGQKVLEDNLAIDIGVEPEVTVPDASSGGGCSYNPNSKSFDMMFLFMMALGALYPFRRRFLK